MSKLTNLWISYALVVVGVFSLGIITCQMIDFVMYQ